MDRGEGNREGKWVQDWSEEGEAEFIKKIEEIKWEKMNVNEEWEELKQRIKDAVSKKKIKRMKREVGNKPWWDRECWEGKKKLKKVFKRGNREGREEEIRIARIEYKQLCNKKRDEWKKREEKIWREIRTDKQAWGYINRFRKKRKKVNKEIMMEEWKKYFMELLEGSEKWEGAEIDNGKGNQGAEKWRR